MTVGTAETSYAYDRNNRLLGTSTVENGKSAAATYYYDNNGNQVSKICSSLSPAGTGCQLFTLGGGGYELYYYDLFNQMVAANVDGVEATYAYGPDGLRTGKASGGASTQQIWSGGQVVLEAAGSTYTKYVRGVNLIASANGVQAGAVQNYFMYNAHGDVVQLTNTSGAVTKSYNYDAFGNEKDPAATDKNPWRYCGEYFDLEMGTYYLRARC